MFLLTGVTVLKVVSPKEGKKAFKVITLDMAGSEERTVPVYVMPEQIDKYKGMVGKQIKELKCRCSAFQGLLQVFAEADPVFAG